MIKKKYRIKKIKEFNYMFRNGKRVNSNTATLIAIKHYHAMSRLGISISSKVGNAVVRNKIKRRLRAIYHELEKNEQIKTRTNYILVARVGIEKLDFIDLKKDIENLFDRIKAKV